MNFPLHPARMQRSLIRSCGMCPTSQIDSLRHKALDRQQPVTDKPRRGLPAVPAVVMSTVSAVMSSGVVVIITVDPRTGARIACRFLLRILLGVGLVFAIVLRRSVLLFRRARRRRNRLRRNLRPGTRIAFGTRP